MKQTIVVLLGLFFLASCASTKSKDEKNHQLSKQVESRALSAAVSEMKAQIRKPASAAAWIAEVGPNFEGLRKELKVVVLPKRTQISSKSSEMIGGEFGPAMVFRFQAQRLVACNKLAQEKLNKFPNKDKIFLEVSKDKTTQCAILNVKRIHPELRPAEYRSDIIAMNLYLDSNYKSYGADTTVGYSRKDIQTFAMSKRTEESLSSGLSFFPVDLPGVKDTDFKPETDVGMPEDPGVKAQLVKWGAEPNCQKGFEVKYRDSIGSAVRQVWCSGDRWPSVVETDRYLAVTKLN